MLRLFPLFIASIFDLGLNIFNGRLGYCVDGLSDMSSCYNEYQNTVFNWQVVSRTYIPILN